MMHFGLKLMVLLPVAVCELQSSSKQFFSCKARGDNPPSYNIDFKIYILWFLSTHLGFDLKRLEEDV